MSNTLPSWKTIDKYYFDHERLIKLDGSPLCSIRFEKNPSRIILMIEVEIRGEFPEYKFKNIAITHSKSPNGINIACDRESLFEFFYMTIESVVADIQDFAIEPFLAIDSAFSRLAGLIESYREEDLSKVVVGLWGELHLLSQLVDIYGPIAVTSWCGPDGEIHDFRAGSKEIEVKATAGKSRKHLISGLEQLQSSSDSVLFLYSIVICSAAGGESLLEKVGEVSAKIGNEPSVKNRMDGLLDRFKEVLESEHAKKKYKLRMPCGVVEIDSEFPAITMNTLRELVGDESVRVDDVKYRVDVTGLVHEEGSDLYKQILRDLGL